MGAWSRPLVLQQHRSEHAVRSRTVMTCSSVVDLGLCGTDGLVAPDSNVSVL